MGVKINLNSGWRFLAGNMAPKNETEGWGGAKARAYSFGAAAVDCNDAKWRLVDLPHDFVSEGDYTRKKSQENDMQKIPEMESIDSRLVAGGSLEGGVAWYRRVFELKDVSERRVYLFFGGVFRDCTVYLNEYFIGRHTSGYTSFYFDITDFVNPNGKNTLAVRVDATGREGWWYEGGGIYRDVWLQIENSVHIAPWGDFVHTSVDLKNRSAEITVETELVNKNTDKCDAVVEAVIYDADGNETARVSKDITIDAWDNAVCRQNVRCDNIKLWDLDDPYLYKAVMNIYVGGTLTDSRETPLGIRDIRFDSKSGLYLNGKNVKVKGLCCHHDHAGVGIAMTEEVYEYRLTKMKRMGANAYRCAHHPPTPALLDICDRLGILVFDETRRMSAANEDLEQLRAMVKRDRNHPSIFLWGIGNEEIFSQNRPETARTTITMKAEIKKLDPSRPVTSAIVCWDGKERFDTAESYVDVTKHLDVMGFNYCVVAWDDYHERMKDQPIIITEASTSSWTRGCYDTCEINGHYYTLDEDNINKCENKRKAVKKDIGETEWQAFCDRSYLAGIFLWTGFDYRGEPTPFGYPAVYSQFGIFDYCGFEKDNYYYYKSWWTDEPTIHVFPNMNAVKPGETTDVHCYGNTDEVELFVGEKSYGRKRMEKNRYVTWNDVVYDGSSVTVKGYVDGDETISETVHKTGDARSIAIKAYKSEVNRGGTAIIDVSIVDENGDVVPTADNLISFEIGGGELLGTGNGDPGSHENEKIPQRRAFNGRCQLLVKAAQNGKMRIDAKSRSLVSAQCEINII